jgi:outer membrane protein TolC
MHLIFDRGAGPTALMMILSWLPAVSAAASGPLSLEQAWQLATVRDAGREALEDRAAAMREMAVSSGALPDPEARLGAVNVPVDSFSLDSEEMTMLEVGIRQRFPAGGTRSISRAKFESRALEMEAEADDRAREVRFSVEQAWRELDYLEEVHGLLDEEQRWLDALAAGAGAAYAAGEGGQLELLDARLMRLDIEERRIDLQRDRETAEAGLSRWIGEAAYGNRVPAAPARPVPALVEVLQHLDSNPGIEALDRAREAASRDVDLAGERYKPSFGLDVAYGFRQGRGMAGSSRPDMLTAMLTFDVPLFTSQRQDREAAAARAQLRAIDARRIDALLALEARLRSAHARAARLEDVVGLYESEIARLADVSVEAALAAYRASDGSLADVVETQRRVIEIRVRLARARKEHAVALAEIRYLSGDNP